MKAHSLAPPFCSPCFCEIGHHNERAAGARFRTPAAEIECEDNVDDSADDIVLDLLVWSALMNRGQLAFIFWKKTNVSIKIHVLFSCLNFVN